MMSLLSRLLTSLVIFASIAAPLAQAALPLDKIKLPPGFTISLYSDKVPNARQMAWGAKGNLFVGSKEKGQVYAITPAKEVIVIAKGLEMPSGIAFRNGSLYVAAVSKILRYDGIEQKLRNPPAPVEVVKDLPNETHHGWKFIAFGPDGMLYVPVGAPCNICKSDKPIYASILRMKPDGTGREIFASGIRNTVGFDWDPATKALWFTDNGRDMLGDNLPPDELNRAASAGMHFGYPHCHAGTIPDPDPQFSTNEPCSKFTAPMQTLGPHVAALGMRFYTGQMFPAAYRGRVFIAEHGSWNRSTPLGYRITSVRFENKKPVYETFAEGWLQNQRPWGRPADVINAPDGALLVSDDFAGAIYRISTP